MINRLREWGRGRGLADIENQIKKIIKQGRLEYLGLSKYKYTEKDGGQREYNVEQLAQVFVMAGNWGKQMETLNIFNQDIIDILYKLFKDKTEVKK